MLLVPLLFQSTRPCGARLRAPSFGTEKNRFQSTRPCGARPRTDEAMPSEVRFQSTRPCGARPSIGRYNTSLQLFQSTRPCGARLLESRRHARPYSFQSTRPCGARRPVRNAISPWICFNPRARAGRDEMYRPGELCGVVFQSTRPCGARHAHRRGDTLRGEVSIHAPVRGATCGLRSYGHGRSVFQSTRPCGARPAVGGDGVESDGVSIHAPVRGATLHHLRPARRASCFNPRARAGRDVAMAFADEVVAVSIHAPVRGATRCNLSSRGATPFQSTRPCGARRGEKWNDAHWLMFQSTRPCGARRLWGGLKIY